ncbi:MAG: PQQ-binding-like beta-propeller repeat protein [Gemmatimonadota bacterium]|nr:PQQ-binding-like beta-propeller repeat protein [Gemmatimonadota bacterium]
MPRSKNTILIGVGGHVVALDTSTGTERWRTKLKSAASTITLWDTGDQVYAGVNGELYCLATATGEVLWHNKLKGLGLGLVCFGATSDVLVAAAINAARAAAASG